MTLLQLDGNNRFTLPHRVAKELGVSQLGLDSWSDRHLLLTVPAADGKPILAGTLGELTVGDLLSFFNMFRKTGVLCFNFPGGKKEIFFQLGEIVLLPAPFLKTTLGKFFTAWVMSAVKPLKTPAISPKARLFWESFWWIGGR